MESVELKIQQANLGYKKNPVIENVSLSLTTRQTVCLLGKNGAGKTTLFKSLLGILPVLSGKIKLNGKNIVQWNRKKISQIIAHIPQARSLPFPFTVFQVVLFGRTAYLSAFSSPGKKDKIIAEECLDRLNILYLKDKVFTQLSGGEQQMVIIARALAQQPSFLIMDEPTSSLDFGNQVKIIQQVNDLRNDNLGIFMATHNPDHAFMCNAEVVIVHDRKIWKKGHCNEIVTRETLKEIYNADIEVSSVIQNGNERKICIPDYRNN